MQTHLGQHTNTLILILPRSVWSYWIGVPGSCVWNVLGRAGCARPATKRSCAVVWPVWTSMAAPHPPTCPAATWSTSGSGAWRQYLPPPLLRPLTQGWAVDAALARWGRRSAPPRRPEVPAGQPGVRVGKDPGRDIGKRFPDEEGDAVCAMSGSLLRLS